MNESSEIDRPNPKCEYIRNVQPSLAAISEVNNQTFFDKLTDGSVRSPKDSILELGFDIILGAAGR